VKGAMKNIFARKGHILGIKSGKQFGFSLIELLVAFALGITVIGGMYTLFSVNKESIRILSNVSLAQEKANFALEVMAEDVQMAGWPGVFDPPASDPFGDRANGTYGQFEASPRFDTFVVSRRGRVAIPSSPNPLLAQNELDCVGDPIIPGQALVHRYFVDPATKELICQSLPSGEMQTIIGNVEGFKVLYGVDTVVGPCVNLPADISTRDASAECMRPTTFVDGDALAATLLQAATDFNEPSQLRPVKAIKLGIVVSTEESNIIDRDLGLTKSHFHLLGQHYGHNFQGANFNEGRVLKYSMRTVNLRQALRGP